LSINWSMHFEYIVLRLELRLSRLLSRVVFNSSVAVLNLSNSFSQDRITSGSIFFFLMLSWIFALFSSYSVCAFTYIFLVSCDINERCRREKRFYEAENTYMRVQQVHINCICKWSIKTFKELRHHFALHNDKIFDIVSQNHY